MFVWKHSLNDWWLLQRTAQLQPASEVAELVDRASVTACNKQIDRWRAPIPSLRAGWGICTLQEC